MRRAALSCLLLLGLGGTLLATPGASADPEAQRRVVVPGRYFGPAFDTCRAPTDGEMADVKRHSRFRGVGVYLGGVQRKCTQPALTAGWVRRQVQRGWHVFPLWVGPQASCSAYENRMSSTRKVAFAQGRRQATAAIATAGRHAIARGSTLYYDLEYYDISGDRCRRAALAFMSGWTKQLRDKGFRSGIYSSVTAAITSLNFADEYSPGTHAMPHDIWYAWANGKADTAIPRKWVSPRRWDDHQRIHQYLLDEERTFGDTTLTIDANWVDVR